MQAVWNRIKVTQYPVFWGAFSKRREGFEPPNYRSPAFWSPNPRLPGASGPERRPTARREGSRARPGTWVATERLEPVDLVAVRLERYELAVAGTAAAPRRPTAMPEGILRIPIAFRRGTLDRLTDLEPDHARSRETTAGDVSVVAG